MKVLLINPPFSRSQVFGQKAGMAGALLPPLGLAYLASVLERNGHSVEIVDGAFLAGKFGYGVDHIQEKIRSSDARIVGVTAMTPQIKTTIELINAVKLLDPGRVTVLGGPHITATPEIISDIPSLDYGVSGEGEFTFLELVDNLSRGKDGRNIPGVLTKTGGRAEFQPRAFHSALDDIPFPSRRHFNLNEYHPALTNYRRLPATQIMTSRGCPHRCIFCQKSTTGNKFRAHSPRYVLDEITTLVNEHGIKDIQIFDDTFTLNPERVEEICRGIRERKLDIGWNCMTRADTLTPALLKSMKTAGCYQVGIGVESGSPRILKLLSKGVDKNALKRSVLMVKSAGIEVRCFFMIGVPTETREEVLLTIDFARELNPDVAQFLIATPYPDTPMWDLCRQNGVIQSEDFSGFTMYRSDNLPFCSNTLPGKEIQNLFRSAIVGYYLRPRYILMQLKKIRSREDIKRFWAAISVLAKI